MEAVKRMIEATIPPYVQIADGLLERIEAGELLPGDRLPSERELSERLGITRVTLRQALRMLEVQGLLIRRPGAGTFVASLKWEREVEQLLPFGQGLRQQGYCPEARLIVLEKRAASVVVARKLRLPVGAPVYYCQRLRLVNQEPAMLEEVLLSATHVPQWEQADFSGRSVNVVLAEKVGLVMSTAVQTIEAVSANEYEAAWLGIKTGSPLILVKRTAYDQHGRALHISKELYRGDRFRFISSLSAVE